MIIMVVVPLSLLRVLREPLVDAPYEVAGEIVSYPCLGLILYEVASLPFLLIGTPANHPGTPTNGRGAPLHTACALSGCK